MVAVDVAKECVRVVVVFVVVKSATNGGFSGGGLVGGEMLRGNKQTAMKSRRARAVDRADVALGLDACATPGIV